MLRTTFTLIVALHVAPQEKAPPSIEQELERLVSKTNALETFHVIYGFEGSEGEGEGEGEGLSLELVYRAPDLGRLIASFPDGEAETWVVGKRIYARFSGEDFWRSAAVPDPSPAHEVLDDRFPAEEGMLEPGVGFEIAFAATRFNSSVRRFPCGRWALVSWLREMQGRVSELFVEDERLGWDGDGVRCFVSRKTGFLERVENTSKVGERPFLLLEGHFDEPLDPSLVILPDQARNAESDPELRRSLEQRYHPTIVRREGILRITRLLDSEERSWDERTRADCRAFLDVLHREWNGAWLADLLDDVEKSTTGLADWVRAQRSLDASDENRARLEEKVAEHRARLEENLDEVEVRYAESVPAIESITVVREELLELELDVIGDLVDELLREPALELFDEELEAALEE